MAHHLHLPPRMQDELTAQEWAEAVAAIDQIRQEMAKKD